MKKRRSKAVQGRTQIRPAAVFGDEWQGASAVKFADSGEVLERLGQVVAERDRFGASIAELVDQGRSQGLTWTQLGVALGVSPQAVQKKYGRKS